MVYTSLFSAFKWWINSKQNWNTIYYFKTVNSLIYKKHSVYSYDNNVWLELYVCVAIGGHGGGSALKGRYELARGSAPGIR